MVSRARMTSTSTGKEASMALSDEQIVQLSLEWSAETNDWASHIDFARAIEAEVQKQDDALILQLVDALGVATTPLAKDRQEVLMAITAARARLEGKP
jgi:hypothetical protein